LQQQINEQKDQVKDTENKGNKRSKAEEEYLCNDKDEWKERDHINTNFSKYKHVKKVKLSRYMPWRRMGGEEV
jgi:hypothetical protein